MKHIEIKDLETAKKMDAKAMASLVGGCCPNPSDLPDGSAYLGCGGTTMYMANPFDNRTIYGRYLRIPSYLIALLTPA